MAQMARRLPAHTQGIPNYNAVSRMVRDNAVLIGASFTIRSPQFAQGVLRGAEMFGQMRMERDADLHQRCTDRDTLQFLTSYLTPFSRYAVLNVGALFGWVQAAQQVFASEGAPALDFVYPAFQKAFFLGLQDMRDGLEDLDCDTGLTAYVTQQFSPQFDCDLTALESFPVELQRIAGYVCGVIVELLSTLPVIERLSSPCDTDPTKQAAHDQAQAPIVPILPQKRYQRPGTVHLFEGILPYLLGPENMQRAIERATGLTYEQLDDFSQGYLFGNESAYSDAAQSREQIPTSRDLWAFLEGECGPHVLAREEQFDQLCHLTPVPIAFRAGFLVGYLHTVFAPAEQSQEIDQ